MVWILAFDCTMPREIPVATVAIGKAGAVNAGLLAAQILGVGHSKLQERLSNRRTQVRNRVLEVTEMKDY